MKNGCECVVGKMDNSGEKPIGFSPLCDYRNVSLSLQNSVLKLYKRVTKLGKFIKFALFLFQFNVYRIAQWGKICKRFSGKNLWVFPHGMGEMAHRDRFGVTMKLLWQLAVGVW